MGSWQRSVDLARRSFVIIRADSELLVFPVLACLASIAFTVAMMFPTVIRDALNEQNLKFGPLQYAVTFATYLGLDFIATFFNVCVVYTTRVRLKGGDATLGQSLAFAFSRIAQIFLWSLLAASVGLLLRSLEWAGDRLGVIGSLLLKIVASFLGAAWSIMTIFVVPVMVYEGLEPFAAIGRSVETLKKTWGESLIRHYGFGLVQLAVTLPAILGIVGVGWGFASGLPFAAGLTIIAVLFVYVLCVALVFSVANSIFNTALYAYASTGEAPAGWPVETLRQALQPRG